MTASSFCSVSLRPPLVLVCVDHLAETYLHVRERGRFGVSILREEQEALSEFFADPERNPDAARRLGIHYNLMKSGTPVLADTLANLDCVVVQAHAAGDHTIFVAEVKEVSVAEGAPLLYFRGRYGACRERQRTIALRALPSRSKMRQACALRYPSKIRIAETSSTPRADSHVRREQ